MKRSFILLFILVFTLGIFAFSFNIFAKDLVEQFDDLMENDEFDLYTNLTINNDESFYNNTSRIAQYYYVSENIGSSQGSSTLRLSVDNCNFDTKKCDFHLKRDQYIDGNYSVENVKDYSNITVKIHNDIASSYPMVDNDTLTINYDETMFDNDSDKQDYVINYFNSYYEGSNTSSVQYSIDYFSKYIYRYERQNNFITKVICYEINDIVFDYVEEPYTDEFKALTSGSITIKSDTPITTNLLMSYIYNKVSMGSSNFYYDGNIKNNKVFIVRKVNNNVVEKHLVNLIQDTNISMTKFQNAGYGSSINIPADQPDNPADYANRFFSYSFGYGDGESFTVDYSSFSDPDNGIVVYRNNSVGGSNYIEFHKAPIAFAGYASTVSQKFHDAVGDAITIHADELSIDSINRNLDYPLHAISCNSDYSVCDIGYYDFEARSVEIHKTNIIFDDSISDYFIKAFNIDSNNKIKIVLDNGVLFPSGFTTFYSFYNEKTHDSLNFECGVTCTLSLKNYTNGYSETHNIEYVTENSNRTSYYSSLIKDNVDVYPGENTNFYNVLSYKDSIFTKDGTYNNRVRSYYCDPNTNKCAIIIFNNNKQLEIHFSNINVKTGISNEFSKVLSGDTVKINSIYKNDEEYLMNTSLAYLINKTKSWTYLTNYHDNTGLIILDGLESHTKNIEFATGNDAHKSVVDEAITRINNASINPILDDMEFVNYFYYNKEQFSAGNNFDSKTLNDALTSVINNKHISYFYVVEGGGGCPFLQGYGGKLVLYYDGIGYGVTDYINTTIRSIVYVPSNTADTKEAFIQAAQKRINDYLGKDSNLFVEFSRELNANDLADIPFDYTGSDGNAYRLVYDGKEEEIIIIKDSSKMKNSTFAAKDVNNNVNVTSENANYPTNTVVTSDKISKKDSKYKDVLKELKVENAEIIDINLFSPVYGYMKDFNNVDFEVSVPVDTSKFDSNKLYAYYIDDNKGIEEHPITMDEFIANFETGHFSTYIITEKISSKAIDNYNKKVNPGTGDYIYNYVLLLIISCFGLCGSYFYFKKNYINKRH